MDTFESFYVFLSSFSLIALAEFGDKSQLVCMTLAARHRHWPVTLGAAAAFILLNTLAVVFGASVAAWVPEKIISGLVALIFGAFGIHALVSSEEDTDGLPREKPGHSIFITTVLLLTIAEFGDKTQIAVAGLASHMAPLPVWVGATVALILVSSLGIWAGRTVLQRVSLERLKKFSGVLFLAFAVLAAWQVYE